MVRKSLNTHGTFSVYLLCRLITVRSFQKNRFGEIVNSGSKSNSKVQSTLMVLGWPSAFRATSIYHVCIEMRPKNTCVSTNMLKNIRVGRSEILFIFCQLFIC